MTFKVLKRQLSAEGLGARTPFSASLASRSTRPADSPTTAIDPSDILLTTGLPW